MLLSIVYQELLWYTNHGENRERSAYYTACNKKMMIWVLFKLLKIEGALTRVEGKKNEENACFLKSKFFFFPEILHHQKFRIV